MLNLSDPNLLRNSMYLNGEWLKPNGYSELKVTNPATGKLLAAIPQAKQKDVIAAIDGANKAFIDWSSRPAKERSELLHRWHALVVENVNDLASKIILFPGSTKP